MTSIPGIEVNDWNDEMESDVGELRFNGGAKRGSLAKTHNGLRSASVPEVLSSMHGGGRKGSNDQQQSRDASVNGSKPGSRRESMNSNMLRIGSIRHRRASVALQRTGNIFDSTTSPRKSIDAGEYRKSIDGGEWGGDNKRGSITSAAMMPEEEVKKKKTPYENLVDWSLVTNVHGSYYVLEQDVHILSTIFWCITYFSLWGFAFYLIATTYIGWRDNPVLTTVSTTALPIEEVEFPVVTICGLGTIKETVEIAYLHQVARYLKQKGIDINVTKTTTADELLEKYGYDFIHENYPGATLSPVEMVAAMISQNPIEHIRAQIVVNGEYDSCADRAYSDLPSNNHTEIINADSNQICNNLLYDPVTETCYEYAGKSIEHNDAYNVCSNKLGYMIYPFSDRQLLGIIKLIKEGPLEFLRGGQPIWVDLTRSPDGSYKLLDGQKLVNDSFRFLNLTNTNIDDPTQRCFIMYYSTDLKMFIGKQASCRHSYPTLCYSLHQGEPNCSANTAKKLANAIVQSDKVNGTEINLVDRLLNPKTRSDINKDVAKKKKKYFTAFRNLDIIAAYPSLFELLWYSQLPCFDVNGFSEYRDQRSLLKQCKWKGINIPCSAIFKTVPTDRGMCCTFNMKEADEIFNQSTYQTMVSQLQKNDKNQSYSYSGLPDWYTKANEPTSQQGINRGLTITLDAHTDLIGSSTVSDDFQGFIAIVNSRSGYPLSQQESIRISPGHDTLVAMSATDVQADLEYMEVKDRKCYYSNGKIEDELMIVHNSYSQSSCILECQIAYAMDRMTQVGEEPCIPWYLPTLTKDAKMCNPWSAVAFKEQIDLIPNDQCKYCLPDCKSTIYRQYVTTVPFRRCDNKNLGISTFCNLDDTTLPDPPIFGKQVLKEFEGLPELPEYIKKIKSNERFYSGSTARDHVFKRSNQDAEDLKYDAYEKDIAVVHFYFESPTIFQYTRGARMSWVDFVAQIGGLLGVCLGYSICMFVEQCYWYLFRLWVDVRV